MLLQRLRSAEPTIEAAIAYNLVDLALVAPESAFSDIIRTFSTINRSAQVDDPRFSNNMVRLALASCYLFLDPSRYLLHKRDLRARCIADRNYIISI